MSIETELNRDEGRRLWPYRDTQGHLTWGIGHNLDAAPLCPQAAALINQAIDAQFQADMAAVYAALGRYSWYASLDTVRQWAVENMMFNLGAATFAQFINFISYMAAGQYALAAQELLNSLAARQNATRYQRLSRQIETGIEAL